MRLLKLVSYTPQLRIKTESVILDFEASPRFSPIDPLLDSGGGLGAISLVLRRGCFSSSFVPEA